eukprot:gene56193-1049_t
MVPPPGADCDVSLCVGAPIAPVCAPTAAPGEFFDAVWCVGRTQQDCAEHDAGGAVGRCEARFPDGTLPIVGAHTDCDDGRYGEYHEEEY